VNADPKHVLDVLLVLDVSVVMEKNIQIISIKQMSLCITIKYW
jgi:hypothetical protein